MGDSTKPSIFNFNFGGKSDDPDLNIPVTGNTSGLQSPYLSFNPTELTQDNYVLPEGHRRGRFEKAFAQIGGSIFAGAALGGANGLYMGVKETKGLAGQVKRTQMLNLVTKQGASSAQTIGVVALLFSMFGVGLSLVRNEEDDINTIVAGAATGLAFKSSAGLKSCLRGGGVGLGLATLYILCTSDSVRANLH